MPTRRAALFPLLALLLALRAGAATFSVSTTTDSGSTSLRDAISSATAPGNTVAWGAGSGGAILLATDLPAIVDQTTLDVSAAPSSVTIQGSNLRLSGGVTFANTSVAQPWRIDSGIVGVGSMTKTGAGTLILTGANSYSGGTFLNAGKINIQTASALGSGALTFNGGVLQTGTTVSFSNAISLSAGGGTIDTLGNNSTFSGVISGVGALTNASTATLALTGRNTYTGGTFLSSGTLRVNGDSALGGAAGGLTFNGGILQLAADLTTARAITLTGGGAFDTNGQTLILNGAASGAGGLTKLGAGSLSLMAANTYGGATAVNAGALVLGINNALPAATNLTVASGATLDLGAYQSTVNTFTSAGTVKTTLLGATASKLVVTGARNITGGTLVVAVTPGQLVANGQAFTVITSGSNGGTDFGTIVSPAALLFTPTYTATSVVLTASFVPLARTAATGNQSAIGAAFEPFRTNPTGDAAVVLPALYSLDSTQLRAALDQLSPVSLASMQGVGQASAGAQSAAVGARIAALADGSAKPGFSSYNVSGRSSYPGVLVAETLGDDNSRPPAPSAAGAPWGYFATFSGVTGRLTEGVGPNGTQPGYSFNSGGLTMGADYRYDELMTYGGSLGYLKGHSSVYAPGSGTVDDNSVRFGGYAAANDGNFHADGYLGSALDFFKTRRDILIPGLDKRTATGSPMGVELNVNGNLSYDFPTREYGTWSPFAGLSYDRMMIGSFSETGADTFNLDVSRQTAESLQSTLGLKLSQKWVTEAHTFVPHVSLAWRHELKDQSRPITARFATGVASLFTVMSGGYARDGTVAGVGLSATLTQNLTGKLDYSGDFRSHFVSTTINADLRLRF